MSGIASILSRPGLRRGMRAHTIASVCQHRSVSWIPWEQPNPQLYVNQVDPVHNLQSTQGPNEIEESDIKQPVSDTPGAQTMRKVGEATIAPATAAVGTGNQEVSTSGKTIPTSIQAGTSRTPFTQTRNIHTSAPNNTPTLLPLATTLLCIPGMPSTWPVKTPSFPDQPRIRKLKLTTIHEHTSAPQRPARPIPPADETPLHFIDPNDIPTVHPVPDADMDPYPGLSFESFEEAVARYMDGVKAREEALAAIERSTDPRVARRALDEVERAQWRRVVWAALENLPRLPVKGEGERGEGSG